MEDFSAFLIDEIRLQLDNMEEANSHGEIEQATDTCRRYLERLQQLIGGNKHV